jgi:molybdate transport system substrate-binding protein
VRYPIAVITMSAHPDLSRGFADFVISPEGQAVLKRYGFGAP